MMYRRAFRHRHRGGRDEHFVVACRADELADGEIRRVEGLPALVCRDGDRIAAVAWMCPHSAARLDRGRIVDGCLECPLHGALFALGGGRVRRGPARRGLATFEVRIIDGLVCVGTRPRRPFFRW